MFLHPTGSSSILIIKDNWVEATIPVNNCQLAAFYSEYLGASIGDGHIMIGTPIRGGINVSHGYQVPDLEEMTSIAVSLGLPKTEDFEVFMMQASWMFLYGMRSKGGPIVRYDRDFGKVRALIGIEELLEQWWQIEEEDAEA